MKKFVSTSIIILAFYLRVFSQLTDSFSDGEYYQNPAWEDLFNYFSVEQQMLKLNAPSTESFAYITTSSNYLNNSLWEFSVRLEFNPSSSNYLDVYVVADDQILNDHILGYFIRIGGSNDEICLFRRDGYLNQAAKLIDGPDFQTSHDIVDLRIKLERDNVGKWKLYAADPLNANYKFLGECEDTLYNKPNYFGFFCHFTSSRNDKFFFDDIKINGEQAFDHSAPLIDSAYFSDPGQITCVFNEKIKSGSVKISSNYQLSGVGMPDSVLYDPFTRFVTLLFHQSLTDGKQYGLTVMGIEDLSGNLMEPYSSMLIYNDVLKAFPGSIVINEIMSDPLPAIDLPEYEYVELLNTTDKFISLAGCRLNNKILSDVILAPKGYIILCNKDYIISFLKYHFQTLGVSGWDVINNEGDRLILTGINGELLDVVDFKADWITDKNKKEGGWSLELINYRFRCWGQKAWHVSISNEGGTPGMKNSVYSSTVRNESPGIWDYTASGKLLYLEFSDPAAMDLTPDNFKINGNNILEIMNSKEASSILKITLQDSLRAGIPYSLTINNLLDCSQTYSTDTTMLIGQGVSPGFLGTLITEVMVDENPSRGLPESEYIELYNPGDKIINLSGCKLIVGPDTVNLPDKCLLPDEYRILCPVNSERLFKCRSIGINNFPVINNSGEKILLSKFDGNLVFYLEFNENWYSGGFRGGISMEMVDSHNPCGKANNWGLSINQHGGTPGFINSIYDSNPDNIVPTLESVSATPDKNVFLKFSEPVNISRLSINDFIISDNANVEKIDFLDMENIICLLKEPLEPDFVYKLRIYNLIDCSGNYLDSSSPYEFVLPSLADSLDIVINEVLFNPIPGGVDYIEIYNRSNKFIDLHDWKFNNSHDTVNNKSFRLSELPYIISPRSYKAFTVNKARTINDFPHSGLANIVQISGMPVMNDQEGSVVLTNDKESVIDSFYYSEEFHFRLLNNFEGVSLERINQNKPTNFPENWHSASEQSGYGTPGMKNSSNISDSVFRGSISVEPKVFSPDSPEELKRTFINYNFEKPGFVANVMIYNINGKLIRNIASNQLISTSGNYSWDGICENGIKAQTGYYIIFFEVYNLAGERRVFKDKVVVGTIF